MSNKKPSWRDTLYLAARSKGVEFSGQDAEDIKNADDNSPLALWVREHFDPDNILTAEELEIWQRISQVKAKSHNENEDELSCVPLNEAELRKAIAALEASTQIKRVHIGDIQRQKSLLATHETSYGSSAIQSTAFQHMYERKQQTEAQQLKFHNVELSTNLKSDLKATQVRIEKVIRSLPSRTTERLRFDDRTFENLNDVLNGDNYTVYTDSSNNTTSAPSPKTINTPSQNSHIQSLLSSLRKATTLQSQLHLSTLYLQTLSSPVPQSLSRVHDSEVQHLQSDLSSLHESIEDISAMLVHSLHGQNLESSLRHLESIQADLTLRDTIYVHGVIGEMTRNLEDAADKTELVTSYRMLLAEIEGYLDQLDGETQSQVSSQSLLPLAPPPPQLPPSASLIKTQADLPALSSLLQHLNIPFQSTSSITPSPPPPSLDTLSSQIVLSSQTLLPNIHSLLPATMTKTTTATATSISTQTSFNDEVEALSRLEDKVGRAKGALEAIAAGDDDSADARERFVRGWQGRNNSKRK